MMKTTTWTVTMDDDSTIEVEAWDETDAINAAMKKVLDSVLAKFPKTKAGRRAAEEAHMAMTGADGVSAVVKA